MLMATPPKTEPTGSDTGAGQLAAVARCFRTSYPSMQLLMSVCMLGPPPHQCDTTQP